jgi:RNA-directed DNA polymerase
MFERDTERNLRKIQRRLRDGAFEFEPQKGVLKRKSSGGVRGIVMASVQNRIVERAWLDQLQSKSDFIKTVINQPTSVGGVPGRSVPHGLKLIRDGFDAGKQYFVRSDISGFFDNIPRDKVIARIAQEIDDKPFMATLNAATTVVLENEKLLGENRSVFPTDVEGVAQGSPLSPLFGNILLYEFDIKFNDRGVICVRFIDDFIILADSEKKANKAFENAKDTLKSLNLDCHDPFGQKVKTEKAAFGKAEDGFVFLGYDIRPGLYQPSLAARKNIEKSINEHISFGKLSIEATKNSGNSYESRQRYAQTHVLLDKVIRGWGDAFAYSNASATLDHMDEHISNQLDAFRDWFAAQLKGQDWKTKRRMGGVGLLADIQSKSLDDVPFTLENPGRFVRSVNMLTISTDGSTATQGRKRGKDQGPGAWAFVVHETNEERSGRVPSATNNQMELRAVIEAIRFAGLKKSILIRTDSQYVHNAINHQTIIKTNTDLWSEYRELCADRKIKVVWIKGHAGDIHNERADRLAFDQANADNVDLTKGYRRHSV